MLSSRLLCALLTCLIAQTVLAADFRTLNWGATEGEVLVAHPAQTPAVHQNNMLAWETALGELKVFVFYVFDEDGRLTAAGYESREEHPDESKHVSDYHALNALLREKYSTSLVFETYWRDELYRDDPSALGRAISNGHLQYWWEYETDRTRISHYLDGGDLEIQHTVRYESKISAQKQAERDRAQLLDEL